jgi:hypothetical protein
VIIAVASGWCVVGVKRRALSAVLFQKAGPVQIVRVYFYRLRYADSQEGEWLCQMLPMPDLPLKGAKQETRRSFPALT